MFYVFYVLFIYDFFLFFVTKKKKNLKKKKNENAATYALGIVLFRTVAADTLASFVCFVFFFFVIFFVIFFFIIRLFVSNTASLISVKCNIYSIITYQCVLHSKLRIYLFTFYVFPNSFFRSRRRAPKTMVFQVNASVGRVRLFYYFQGY